LAGGKGNEAVATLTGCSGCEMMSP
jgi:hypothetical protein